MDGKMKIWDLARTEEEENRTFQDKGMLPKTKHCVKGHSMTLCSFDRDRFWKCTATTEGRAHFNAILSDISMFWANISTL